MCYPFAVEQQISRTFSFSKGLSESPDHQLDINCLRRFISHYFSGNRFMIKQRNILSPLGSLKYAISPTQISLALYAVNSLFNKFFF